jgi:hypothetical protein
MKTFNLQDEQLIGLLYLKRMMKYHLLLTITHTVKIMVHLLDEKYGIQQTELIGQEEKLEL